MSKKLAEFSLVLQSAWGDVEPRLKSFSEEKMRQQGDIRSLCESLLQRKNDESSTARLSVQESSLLHALVNKVEEEREFFGEKLRATESSIAGLNDSLSQLPEMKRVDREAIKELQSCQAQKSLEEKLMRDKIANLNRSLRNVREKLKERDGQIDALAWERKNLQTHSRS